MLSPIKHCSTPSRRQRRLDRRRRRHRHRRRNRCCRRRRHRHRHRLKFFGKKCCWNIAESVVA